MLRPLTPFAFAIAMAATPACAGVHEDMVALDRAYVPALALTNQPKAEPAQKALAKLRSAWNRFNGTYATAPSGYEAATWAKSGAEVEAAITAAEKSMAAGRSAAAHDDLERVRDSQFALRRASRQPYFMDDLTAYHAAMEAIASPAAAKTAATISDADIAAIVAALPGAKRTWQDVLANRAQAGKHGLSVDTEPLVQRDIDATTQILADLDAALATGDRARIAEKAMASKPAFSRLFQKFGDFDGLR